MKLHVPLNLLIVALTISPALSSPIPIPDGEVGVVERGPTLNRLFRRVPEPNIFKDLLKALGQASQEGDLHRRA
ncbi:hypothetical protein K443DRAFT_94795 [Laccaria amethystina LaAM-08-1]|uniref:Uncharacterized protein n=1 Tax=Laccaria amethystina LaAM-08-1 TaxID=1095629 RepID=A0A0C9XPX0_9AGAR|nr:hypothetical protein K443DRAFT_94795 [Laccaria amethystina LaAM-08-1]